MSRALIILRSEADRAKAVKWATSAPAGTRVDFLDPRRSIPQNSRLWLMLEAVSHHVWYGQKYSAAEWKDYFMHAYRGEKWMPFEDGGMIPIGRSTSKLSKHEFSDLVALIEAFCARQNISLPWDQEAA